MRQQGDVIKSEQGNVYVVCNIIAPPAGSASTENVIVLAQQASNQNRPLNPEECGTFQMFESEIVNWKKIN